MPLLPVEQPGKPASADWLSTYKPTFNDAQEPASEAGEPAADGAHGAEGGQPDTVGDAVAAVDDGQDTHDGQGGGTDQQDGDADNGGGNRGGSGDTSGDSRGDQRDEHGNGDHGGERRREAELHASQTAAQSVHQADVSQDGHKLGDARRTESGRGLRADGDMRPPDEGDGMAAGNRLLSQGSQMERQATRTPTEWLSDPASGALRAAAVAAGQRIVAEQAGPARRVGSAQRAHEAVQSDRLTRARRVREAEAFIQQRDETASDGSQDAD